MKLLGIIRSDQIQEKKWEYNKTVHQLFINFNKAYDSVRKKVLYNILIRVCGKPEISHAD
jgi:hypothetical protein